jgi:diguanylate cyclase (GGDEF)-like protein
MLDSQLPHCEHPSPMLVRFWGTRGSIPAPGPQTARYGGNTSCVEVQIDDGTVIILDCGTGIRELGLKLLKSHSKFERIYLLIGHTHWDHIQGFPFFTPAFLPKSELNIFAPAGFQRSLEDSLSGQMQYSYFPVKLQDLSSRIHFTELEEGFFRLGDVLVETQYLNHTAPTIAYRISYGGATLAYVTDHEPFWNSPGPAFHHPGDQRHIDFLKGADLVIHDAQYNEEEYKTKHGWGHSTIDYATDVTVAAGARKLALFHHDPTHNDEKIRQFEEYSQARAAAAGSPLEVFAAAEGMEIRLDGKTRTTAVSAESALERRPVIGGRVLVVTGRPSDVSAVEQVLAEDGLVINAATNGQTAIERAEDLLPDLVILSSKLSDGDGASFIQPIRTVMGKPELPILILTEEEESAVLYSAESIATDYLRNPFSPAMLRTRVRAWLARTMGSVFENASVPVDAKSSFRTPNPDHVTPTDILASVDLFKSLNANQLDKLLARSSQRVYPPGHAVIRQGEAGHSIYVVLSGRVRIVESLPDNPAEMFLGELGQGEVFGELGVLRDRPRSATVIPLERTVCLVIPEADFMDALHASPDMALGLVRVLAGRLYEADRMLARYGPDPLTGLPGRRAFHELYKRMSAGARRRGSSVLLVAVDVIHLKVINDRYGYTVGDDVLRTVADVLMDSSRGTDLIARYGGDEFAAMFVEAGAEHADAMIGRIQQKFQTAVLQRGLPIEAELRVGTAVSAKPPETADELLRLADNSIQARRSGAPTVPDGL